MFRPQSLRSLQKRLLACLKALRERARVLRASWTGRRCEVVWQYTQTEAVSYTHLTLPTICSV
eukprot:578671-Rhodomonas_salina.2